MADLTAFGVPVEGSAAITMPKLQYRFRVIMNNFGQAGASAAEFTQNVISVSRPSVSHEEITIDAYNSKTFIAGKHTWEPLTLTLRDDMNGLVNKAVAAQLQKQLSHGTQSAPAAAVQYKFGMKIEQLDGSDVPVVIETWSINGAFIQNVAYGENNYATSDVMQITLTVRFDNADIHSGEATVDDSGALTEGESINPRGYGNATGSSAGDSFEA
jgi:hypothetical protein